LRPLTSPGWTCSEVPLVNKPLSHHRAGFFLGVVYGKIPFSSFLNYAYNFIS
jgi:hypothetical protein